MTQLLDILRDIAAVCGWIALSASIVFICSFAL